MKAKPDSMVELNQSMVDPDILGHVARPLKKVEVSLPPPRVFNLTPGLLAKIETSPKREA